MWKVHLFAIEVGVRGYAACSLRTCLSKLGFTHRSLRRIIKKASDSALRCSFWIWLKREDDEWNHNQRRKQVSKSRQNNECTNREKDPMKSVEMQKKRNQSSGTASQSKARDEPVKRVDSVPHQFEGRTGTRTETLSSQKTRVHQRENINKLRVNKQCPEGSRKPLVLEPSQAARRQEGQMSTPETPKELISGKKPTGIRNLGNTCYIMQYFSALQLKYVQLKTAKEIMRLVKQES